MTCLWHFLDRTVTAPGKRLLRWWVTRPLLLVKDIKQRRVAVEDLLRVAGPGSILAEAEALMKKLPDLERKITRIHAFATASADAQGVAEAWASQRRAVRELVALLHAWRQFDTIRQLLHGLQTDIGSPLLQAVIGDLPDVTPYIAELEAMFDVEVAQSTDTVQLVKGSDEAFDAAMTRKAFAEAALEELLKSERAALNCPRLKFSGTGQLERHQRYVYCLEMPADFPLSKVPPGYQLQGQTKACRRYSTIKLQHELDRLNDAQEAVQAAQRRACAHVCGAFDSRYTVWCLAVTRLAEFDALCALAKASESSDGQPMCAAELVDHSDGAAPILEVRNMRHPVLGGGAGGQFVPNDFAIGQQGPGAHPTSCLILTGPNMGGKSTTLRLACFAALLAQLGCHVPAESCRLTPVDRIFTRLGADDDICRGLRSSPSIYKCVCVCVLLLLLLCVVVCCCCLYTRTRTHTHTHL
jgi:DNA mismatch repair protein MSH6